MVAGAPPIDGPIDGVNLATVPQISTAAFLNRQANYNFGDTMTISAHLARALDDDDGEAFLAVLGNAYGG